MPEDYNGYERKVRKNSNEDEELEHTESEEGNNQDNPNFDNNERVFK
jgi:hypothetical protein